MSTTNSTAMSWRTIDWLRNTRSIAVPIYQRDYRWTQSACETLLRDLLFIAQGGPERTHFLGSVLAKADEEGRVTLVDGQQRVTTIQLMLAAVAIAAREDSGSPTAEIRTLLADPTDPTATRLRPHERFESELRYLLLGSGEQPAPSSLTDNFSFLVDRIGSDWRQVWTGLQRLEHITIGLERASNPQQIFESLNATGARLSDDELIHNYVHMGRTHDAQRELEHGTWIPIEKATAGHTREFWRDYLILTSDTVPDLSGEFGVFKAFKARYPEPLKDLTAALQLEWMKYCELYRVLLHPEHEEHEMIQRQLRLLQVFGGTPRPFMLAVLRDFHDRQIDADRAIETFEALQSLFIRRALVGLERDVPMISRLCAELREDRSPVEELVRRTPEDPAVRLALAHGSVPQAAYVLRRLQLEDSVDVDDLQVEHVHPQTPNPEWSGNGPRIWGGLSVKEQAAYRSVLNTIGNLTLLEAPLNQGAGNRSLSAKGEYYKKSRVPETRDFATSSVWDDVAIRRRTEELTTRFLLKWKRPSDTPMSVVDDLIKVVDLPRPPLRGYPSVFQYAEFEEALWGDVRTSKQLLVRLFDELIRRDRSGLATATYGDLVKDTRVARTSHERLADGRWLYTGWAHRYLLEVAQSLLVDFGLEDSLRVKLAPAAESDSVE